MNQTIVIVMPTYYSICI